MKKELSPYKKYKRTKGKYTTKQIAEGVGLGISLVAFGAAHKGAFNNIDFSKIDVFAKNFLDKALAFYRELAEKCNPVGNVPDYIFLGLAGAFVILMVKEKIQKNIHSNKTVSNLSADNQILSQKYAESEENNKALQATLTKKRSTTPSQTGAQ